MSWEPPACRLSITTGSWSYPSSILQSRTEPGDLLFGCRIETPGMQSILAHPHYRATPPDVVTELRVSEEPAHEGSDLVLAHHQVNQVICMVTKSLLIEVTVACKERGP